MRIAFGVTLLVGLLVACGGKDASEAPAASPVPVAGANPTVEADATPAAATEEAALKNVGWIAAHQSADGRWEAGGWDLWRMGERVETVRLEGLGLSEFDVAVTSLVLLAYVNLGFSPSSDGHRGAVVAWASRWLRSVQREDGSFGDPKSPDFASNHGLAVLAMTKLAEVTSDPVVVASARRGVDRYLSARDQGDLRWATNRPFGGLPPFAWVAMASKLAIDSAERSHHASATGLESRYELERDREAVTRWMQLPPADRTIAKVGAALAMTAQTGANWKARSEVVESARWLVERAPAWQASGEGVDATGWWLGTVGLFAFGGESWKRWESAMKTGVVDPQRKDGSSCDYRGSWDPKGAWSGEGGRVFMTATCMLMLEIWYRYDKVFGVAEPRTTMPAPVPRKSPPAARPIEEPGLPTRRYSPCR